jgi:hypothetical protein
LLIYYAGHGHHDPDTDEAYWLPVDAQSDNNENWISADDITRDAKAIPSLHVLIISDSCYSGVLTRDADAAITPRERGAYLDKMLKSKSRTLMSSGGDEPVADGGAAGHSVFAGAVLDSLRQIEDNQFTAADLFQRFIQAGVAGRSGQVPQYSLIRNSDGGFGDFVFSRKADAAPPTPPVPIPSLGGPGQTPIISNISPPTGSPYKTVTISGSGFSGVNRVMFNSRTAQINSQSDAQLVVIVPVIAPAKNVPPFGISSDVALCTPTGCTRELGKFKYQPLTPTPPIAVIPTLYFADACARPGAIYRLQDGTITELYRRAMNNIYSIAVSPDGAIFFCNANEYNVYKIQGAGEKVVYRHNTYVRALAFDSRGALYFSDATGDSQFAHGDGLPCRRIGTTAQTVWAMQAWALVRSGGILSAMAW